MTYMRIRETNQFGGKPITATAVGSSRKRITTNTNTNVVLPFFSDNFAGPARNNANGFTWSTNDVDVQPVTFDGYTCLRFRFGPDAIGADSNAQQTFNMGRQLQELWMEYYLHIPSNFTLRESGVPNKFLSLWPENYSTVGETYVVTEFWRDTLSSTSYSRMLGLGDSPTGTTIRNGDAYRNDDFIGQNRAGQWNRVRVHYKIASGAGQTDGVYEGWIGDELMWRSNSNWLFWSTGGLNYIKEGYLMGASNSGYTDETDFHLRDIKFYDTNPGWV
jgi:hypothetical protein